MSGRNKRLRENGENYHQRHHQQQQPRIHYSDLTPEVKLQKRRQERQEKKEKDRTLSYFRSVQRALDDQAAGTGDASALASIVDGFFVELIRLLKADSTMHLLRNGTVCRVIESALANSLLLHSKSLLYVLLGHVFDTITSPTASYMMETLMASLAQALSALADDAESFEAEMTDGGPGIHGGSGVPSAATLVSCVVEELSERVEEIILHDVGARAVRSIVLVLGGLTIRGAPPLENVVKFTRSLSTLGVCLMRALESTFSDNHTQRVTDVWLAIANTPTASFILQSLLRVCEAGTEVDAAVRQRLESICDDDGSTLLRHFLMDPLGCHIFQAYIKIPAPLALLETCDVLANRRAAAAETLTSSSERRLQEILRDAEDDVVGDDAEATGEMEQTCWDKALSVVMETLDELLDPAAEHTAPVVYVLQDLALFAPTAVHLEYIWERLLKPRLQAFLSSSVLAQVLAVFARKCAFAGPSMTTKGNEHDNNNDMVAAGGGGGGGGGDALPKDIEQLLQNDVAQGARYFPVSAAFQRTVATTICFTIKPMCSEGAAQYLLVGGTLLEKGFELARYILHFHTSASVMFAHTVDKLCLREFETLMRHAKGSLVIQQYLRATAADWSLLPAEAKNCEKKKADRSASARFLRCITPLVPELIGDTYAAFVLEVLYEVGSLGVKEELVKLLVPMYTGLRHGGGNTRCVGSGRGEGNTTTAVCPQRWEFIARKVMTKCCVELYMHRPDDWTKVARRQCQVLRLLQRMSAISS